MSSAQVESPVLLIGHIQLEKNQRLVLVMLVLNAAGSCEQKTKYSELLNCFFPNSHLTRNFQSICL